MGSKFQKGVVSYFKENLGIIIALIVMCLFLIVFPTTRTTFATSKNIFNILRQNASNLFLATGMTMVIILGGIELSVGSVIALSGCVAAFCAVNLGLPEIVGFLAAIVVGGLVGLFNA
ncbi:MAG: ribose ABC transporter permease, partial [Lachnospiraceae bacterium]|nr:ribose ABC transporter permease [Lachnospiraceae bacterium]